MPKRVIDFDAMWGSDKLAACAAWAQAEYAWLYGLADASGCFELTNLRVIWGRVAAIRANLTIERLEQVFAEFQDKGLLFVWVHEGKRYAHWTGSDVPGRLPPPSWRMRLEKFAPPVPKLLLAEYMARFARGRAALAGAGFRGEAQQECADRSGDLKFEISDLRKEQERGRLVQTAQYTDERLLVADHAADCGFEISKLREGSAPAADAARDEIARDARNISEGGGLKERVEGAQGQDLDLDWNLEGNWELGRDGRRGGAGDGFDRARDAGREERVSRDDFRDSDSRSNSISHSGSNSNSRSNSYSGSNSNAKTNSHLSLNSKAASQTNANSRLYSNSDFNSQINAQGMSAKELAVARELRVGQGPVCSPAGVKPEVLERIRRREAARGGSP